jgi:hypothetical protein
MAIKKNSALKNSVYKMGLKKLGSKSNKKPQNLSKIKPIPLTTGLCFQNSETNLKEKLKSIWANSKNEQETISLTKAFPFQSVPAVSEYFQTAQDVFQTILESNLKPKSIVEILSEQGENNTTPSFGFKVFTSHHYSLAESYLKAIESSSLPDIHKFQLLHSHHHSQTPSQFILSHVADTSAAFPHLNLKMEDAKFAIKLNLAKFKLTLKEGYEQPEHHVQSLNDLKNTLHFIQNSGHFSIEEQLEVLSEFDAFLILSLPDYNPITSAEKARVDYQYILKQLSYENYKERTALQIINKKSRDMIVKQEENIKESVYAKAREEIHKKDLERAYSFFAD